MKKSIFLVVLLTSLILAGCWQKVADDPTADWQTYRNEEYGFEMKYPGDYIQKQFDSGTGGGVELGLSFYNEKYADAVTEFPQINLYVHENTDDLLLHDWLTQDKLTWEKDEYTSEQYNVDQKEGLLFSHRGIVDRVLILDLDGRILELTDVFAGEEEAIYYDQMLSTFKFIK